MSPDSIKLPTFQCSMHHDHTSIHSVDCWIQLVSVDFIIPYFSCLEMNEGLALSPQCQQSAIRKTQSVISGEQTIMHPKISTV